jgi:hypothetical protein
MTIRWAVSRIGSMAMAANAACKASRYRSSACSCGEVLKSVEPELVPTLTFEQQPVF